MNKLHCLQVPYLTVIYQSPANLLHAYLEELHNNVIEIDDDECIVFKGPNNQELHLHSMNDLQ
jgi:hypothetical protein